MSRLEAYARVTRAYPPSPNRSGPITTAIWSSVIHRVFARSHARRSCSGSACCNAWIRHARSCSSNVLVRVMVSLASSGITDQVEPVDQHVPDARGCSDGQHAVQ